MKDECGNQDGMQTILDHDKGIIEVGIYIVRRDPLQAVVYGVGREMRKGGTGNESTSDMNQDLE